MSMDTSVLEQISYWHWFGLGLLLVPVGIAVPGAFFLRIGIASALTGFLLFALPEAVWQIQATAFVVLSAAATLLGRRLAAPRMRLAARPARNWRSRNMVGMRCTLRDDTVNGRGRVRVGDAMWALRVSPPGGDLPAGTEVTVVEVDGVTLVVRHDAAEAEEEA